MKKFILDRRKTKVPTNPSMAYANNLLNHIKEKEVDEIISIGGGSTIDVGKYIAFNLNLFHMAIPTTAGTGSEVTKYAVFTVDDKKVTLENDKLIPNQFIHLPRLITTCPSHVTTSAGLDALSQAIESDWLKPSKEAKKAIKLIMNYLVKSYKKPLNLKYRKKMLEAAMLSGLAINKTRTSICHAISYPLTTFYEIPHGLACGVNLPYFMNYFNYKYLKPHKVKKLLRELDISPERILRGIDIPLITNIIYDSERAKNVPKPVSKEVIKKALCQ